MEVGAITGYIDAAQIVLYVFWIFFAFLVLHLHQESKREGYPLQNDLTERNPRASSRGYPDVPSPKTFRMADGSTVMAPNGLSDDRPIAAKPSAGHPGAPLVPASASPRRWNTTRSTSSVPTSAVSTKSLPASATSRATGGMSAST